MKRLWLVSLAGVTGLLTAALIALSGCGGGGGPIVQPGGGGGGGTTAAFLQLIKDNAPNAVNATYVGSDKCLQCHGDTYHSGWKNTMHFNKNVGCENCHGPGSAHISGRAVTLVKAGQRSRDGDRKDILKLPAIQSPDVCGQCHGPIHDQLIASKHGEVVEDVVDPDSGVRSTTCMRCHSSALRTTLINAPWTQGLIAGKSISTIQDEADAAITPLTQQQLADFAAFTHQTAACVTCHDPHTPTGKKLGDGEEKQLRRLTSNQDTTSVAPGSPGKVTSNWDHICGTCHNSRGGNPADASLQTGTSRPNFHEGPQFNMLSGITGSLPPGTVIQNGSHRTAEDQCVHCHMPDASHTFTVKLDSSCLPCHSAADAAARAGSVRNEILSGLLVLRTKMENWATGKFADSRFWDYVSLVFPDSTSAEYKALAAKQVDVPIEIKRARHNYYFIARDGSLGVHNTPYARQLLAYSISQVDSLFGANSRSIRIAGDTRSFLQIMKQDKLRELRSLKFARPEE